MALHKMVNGIKIDLTPEEEKKIEAEWASNKIKYAALREERRIKKKEKERILNKLMSNLTEEEREIIMPNMM